MACRSSKPADEMLRFARAPDGALGFDVRGALPGRGAWTCASAACVKKALEKGGFERAFEAAILVDKNGAEGAPATALLSTVRAVLESEALADLGILRRAGRLAAGRDDVARAFHAGDVAAVVLASDLSQRSRADVTSQVARMTPAPPPSPSPSTLPAHTDAAAAAPEGARGADGADGVDVVEGPAMDVIGKAIGRKPTGVLAALGGPASRRLVHDLRRLQSFTTSSLAEGPRQA